MSRFISVDRSTEYLLPPSVQDWLPENHLSRFVVDVVERLDLSALIKAYAGRGKDAHHPAVLLGLLIYGYATGVYHSRKIERASYESLAFRYIAANPPPRSRHDCLLSIPLHHRDQRALCSGATGRTRDEACETRRDHCGR